MLDASRPAGGPHTNIARMCKVSSILPDVPHGTRNSTPLVGIHSVDVVVSRWYRRIRDESMTPGRLDNGPDSSSDVFRMLSNISRAHLHPCVLPPRKRLSSWPANQVSGRKSSVPPSAVAAYLRGTQGYQYDESPASHIHSKAFVFRSLYTTKFGTGPGGSY